MTDSSNPYDSIKITMEKDKVQTGYIRVAAQIIQDLSSGIYSSPAIALKELVNNSYDANATNVEIRMLPELDTILIQDDGIGMNAEDFYNDFAWISKSNKRNSGDFIGNRPLIGKIGIGFIAVNEICKKMTVISSKMGENVKFTATINFVEIGAKENKFDSRDPLNGVLRGKFELINEDEDVEKHYTVIRLEGIKETAKKILFNKLYKEALKSKKAQKRSVKRPEFYSMRDLIDIHAKRELYTYAQDDEYFQFVIELASYIPVEYLEGAPIENEDDSVIREIVEEQKKLNFHVDLDGIYLKKPVFFKDLPDVNYRVFTFKDSVSREGQTILKFKGYFYCQNKLLIPRELNGISIKIKNVPIAKRFGFDTTFLDYPNYRDQIFRNWVSSEIYVEEGLEDAMNIDRQSFRETQESYIAIQEYVHKLLREKIFGVIALSLYEQGRESREAVIQADQVEKEKSIVGKGTKVEEVDNLPETVPIYVPILTEKNDNETKILIGKDRVKNYNSKDWPRLKPVILIFETSLRESNGDIEVMRTLFYKAISEYFKKTRRTKRRE